ncbi:hypothetical protein SB717_36900, partial [Priestia sp. SIMBA_032]|uniref:hypothetical protein n=1 Tax=Priestia sp. SIMBA_032 TaxID=3085775 RepID=UPI00397C12F2
MTADPVPGPAPDPAGPDAAGESVAEQLDPSLVGTRIAVEAVPVIDFGRFRGGAPAERRETA